MASWWRPVATVPSSLKYCQVPSVESERVLTVNDTLGSLTYYVVVERLDTRQTKTWYIGMCRRPRGHSYILLIVWVIEVLSIATALLQ